MPIGAIVFLCIVLMAVSGTANAWLIGKLRNSSRQSRKIIALKNTALSILGHEIRNPLSGLLSVVRLLDMTSLNDHQRKLVKALDSTSETLLSLLDESLQHSKTASAATQPAIASFSLQALVDGIVTVLEPQAQEKGLLLTASIEPSLPQTLLGDANRIRQILFNLLGNAIKFTHSGIVKLHVTRKQQASIAIELSFNVIDSGPGIPACAMEKLFTPYFRVESHRAPASGVGLGLSISRDLARSMGGDIAVQSQMGRGSIFTFSLPCTIAVKDRELAIVPSTREAPATVIVPLHLLVVDDSEIQRIAAHALLELAGHRVSVVASASEAIRALQWQAFDCVLMDIHMPEMDGLAAIRMIRNMPVAAGKRVGIILVSAWPEPEDVAHWLDCGADAACSKPLDFQAINEILAAICTGPVDPGMENPDSPLSSQLNCRIS